MNLGERKVVFGGIGQIKGRRNCHRDIMYERRIKAGRKKEGEKEKEIKGGRDGGRNEGKKGEREEGRDNGMETESQNRKKENSQRMWRISRKKLLETHN